MCVKAFARRPELSRMKGRIYLQTLITWCDPGPRVGRSLSQVPWKPAHLWLLILSSPSRPLCLFLCRYAANAQPVFLNQTHRHIFCRFFGVWHILNSLEKGSFWIREHKWMKNIWLLQVKDCPGSGCQQAGDWMSTPSEALQDANPGKIQNLKGCGSIRNTNRSQSSETSTCGPMKLKSTFTSRIKVWRINEVSDLICQPRLQPTTHIFCFYFRSKPTAENVQT